MRSVLLALSAAAFLVLQPYALADTVTVIATDPGATGDFSNPGTTATTGYTITTSDNGTNFVVTLSNPTPNGFSFANLYFDTIASTPNTGSNLGIEVTNDRAFIPGVTGYTSLAGTGFSYTDSIMGGIETIQAIIPNSFFLTDPLGMGFATTPNGTLVSLHLSQSFGYSVVGGGANFPAPVELGAAIVGASSVTPEPSSFVLLGTGLAGVFTAAKRKFITT